MKNNRKSYINDKEQLLNVYKIGMKQKESKLPVFKKEVINGKKRSISKDLYLCIYKEIL